MRVRSRSFILTGGLGGLVGFAITELVGAGGEAAGGRASHLAEAALYFALFGLAVGSAVGMTEGLVLRNRRRLALGAVLGLVLGGLGGSLGGTVGQWLYGLAPDRFALKSTADFALVLDSSGSMSGILFGGSDPWGKRRDAARELIQRLSSTNRVAVVDFDDTATVLFPLTELSSPEVRSAASDAVGKVDDSGKTSLTAGLSAGLAELEKARDPGRAQHLIFLTDGAGAYDPDLAVQAARAGIKIHTVGLGSEVNADLLGNIAHVTGGNYYPVAKASQLVATFNRILERATDMRQARGGHGAPEAEALTNPWLHYTLRVLAWALMGLLLGLGQGLRYNTREDFRACGLGGLLGGALGGALFDPISSWLAFSTGVIGRGVADTVVGASIGGSLRLLQEKLVEEAGKPTHQLVAFLPPSDRRLVFVPTGRTEAAVVVGTSKNRPELQPAPAPGPVAGPAAPPPPVKVPGHSPVPPSIESYSQRYPDRQEAMARAYLEGGLRLSEIAQFFNVPLATVRRAVDRRKGEPST